MPTAHRGACELETIAGIHVLEPVERHVILPPLDDRVGEHAGTGEPARDGQLERIGDEHLGLGVALAILAHELRAYDARDDEGSGAALDRFAHVLANALERVQPFLLDLRREHLDLDARQVLGQRFAACRLSARVRFDLLLGIRGGKRSVELRGLPVAEHHREHVERELRLVIRQVLRLRCQKAELQLPASLHRLQVERAVLVSLTHRSFSLALGSREALLELVEPLHGSARRQRRSHHF